MRIFTICCHLYSLTFLLIRIQIVLKRRLNYTFGPRVLANSRNWSCPFKTEQNCPSIIIFDYYFCCIFRPTPHFILKKRREKTVLDLPFMLDHEINKE